LGFQAVIADVWADGGGGAKDLATTLVSAMESETGGFTPLYHWEQPVTEKIEKICRDIYGASSVDFTARAKKDLRTIKKLELENLPICMAKTQKSLSDDPSKIGRPTGFEITVREIEIAAGAGFLIPITGDMMRMPGLPTVPSSENIDIDSNGEITGLF
jgi:formate--tetrahydrofolate ligase